MTLTFEQKSAINARFQEHYDALKAAGKHGFYETCFEAMHLAYASLALPQQDEWRVPDCITNFHRGPSFRPSSGPITTSRLAPVEDDGIPSHTGKDMA